MHGRAKQDHHAVKYRKTRSTYGDAKYIELERLASETRALHGRVKKVYETKF